MQASKRVPERGKVMKVENKDVLEQSREVMDTVIFLKALMVILLYLFRGLQAGKHLFNQFRIEKCYMFAKYVQFHIYVLDKQLCCSTNI